MTRKVIPPDENEDDKNYVTIVTGGPLKYYNRRRVRRVFAEKLGVAPFEPITAAWFQAIISEIASARHRKQLTQVALASLLGTRQSEISQLECGKTNPTVESLERIFLALGIELDVTIRPK